MNSPFELRLKNIAHTQFHGATIDVMDTFETVCYGLREIVKENNWTPADAVRLTELILARAPK